MWMEIVEQFKASNKISLLTLLLIITIETTGNAFPSKWASFDGKFHPIQRSHKWGIIVGSEVYTWGWHFQRSFCLLVLIVEVVWIILEIFYVDNETIMILWCNVQHKRKKTVQKLVTHSSYCTSNNVQYKTLFCRIPILNDWFSN